ncbi:MAG: pyridoxamine 5'-phosphate oxidase family protein [Rhizobiales bacterium]|nr:pyridoxamine 5'-phosphate oxidase family protein [Hyphomicrobiales bacterium]
MATSTSTSERQNHMWEIARKMDFCMFVTMDSRKPWARPMSTIVRHEEGKIFMLTDRKSVKDDQIKSNSSVVLAYANKPTFLTVRGKARLLTDRGTVRNLWSPGAQAFWPKGPEDKNIVAIEVTPEQAEYWEGDNALVSSAKFAWAIVTRKVAEPGESTKLRLAPSRGKRVSRTSSTRAKTAAKKPAKAKRR